MKTVFLILYLWHGINEGIDSSAGGPALQVVEMPSIAACEAVGKGAKQLLDAQRPPTTGYLKGSYPTSTPSTFRCVEVRK